MKNKEKLVYALDILVYLFLAIMMILRGIKSDGSVGMKIFYFFIALAFLAIGILFVVQKSLYKKAINTLCEGLDVEKATAYYDKLQKIDFLRNYVRQRHFFDLMAMLELNEMDKVKSIIERNEKQFDANDNMKLVKYHYLMRADLYLGNNDEVKKSCNELTKLLDKGVRASLFVRQDNEAIKALATKRYTDALHYFEEIDLNSLTGKDRKWVLKNLVNLTTGKPKKDYEEKLQDLIEKRKAIN